MRTYVKFPDFTQKPLAFVDRVDDPFEGDLRLKNGLWVSKNHLARKGLPSWEVVEAGADPVTGGAAVHSRRRTKREAILAAIAIKPFEHPVEKAKRVEAAAQAGCDPDILTVVDDLLNQCTNVFGVIKEHTKCQIRDYIQRPSIAAWEDIHGIILTGFGTIWQLWITANSKAPRRGPGENTKGELYDEWDLIPTPMEILVILRAAAATNEAKAHKRRVS